MASMVESVHALQPSLASVQDSATTLAALLAAHTQFLHLDTITDGAGDNHDHNVLSKPVDKPWSTCRTVPGGLYISLTRQA
jgi:hypothetical protein